MKRRLSLVPAAAALLSAAMLISCTAGDIVVPGGSDTTSDYGTSGTADSFYDADETAVPDTISPLPPETAGAESSFFYRPYEEIENFDAYKIGHENLTMWYYDRLQHDLSIFARYEMANDDMELEEIRDYPTNLFDSYPETIWFAFSSNASGSSAIVWSMDVPVYVTAYSITTTMVSGELNDRDPVRWRLYGAQKLPDGRMDDVDPKTGMTYFDSMSKVPAGWELIDAVDATDPFSTDHRSLIPDKDNYEAGLKLPSPGYYQHFMLLIDDCEGNFLEMGDFTLYGYNALGSGAYPEQIPYHRYTPVDDLETFKGRYENLMEYYYEEMNSEYSIFSGFDYQVDETWFDNPYSYTPEYPYCLFDGDVNTKWCAASSSVEYCSAVVWSMTQPVNVVGYSLTTGNDNSIYTQRNPVQWRLYATNALPKESMLDIDPATGFSYFDSETVPNGWVLIDAVDASNPNDPYTSLIPDEDFYEAGMLVQNPGSYQYFMLLIDYCEGGTFQLSEFTLYGTPEVPGYIE